MIISLRLLGLERVILRWVDSQHGLQRVSNVQYILCIHLHVS